VRGPQPSSPAWDGATLAEELHRFEDDGAMAGLSAAGLADLAGVTEAEVERLVELGILVARDGPGRFLETDVPKVRLAIAWQRAGCRWPGSRRPSGPVGCRFRCWRPPTTGDGRGARGGPTRGRAGAAPRGELRRAGRVRLQGIAHPVRLLEARRT
jgi:hypothetical protein